MRAARADAREYNARISSDELGYIHVQNFLLRSEAICLRLDHDSPRPYHIQMNPDDIFAIAQRIDEMRMSLHLHIRHICTGHYGGLLYRCTLGVRQV